MDTALLRNLVAGAGSGGQFIGGLVVALLYVVIGLLGAIGSIVVVRRMFRGRWEQIFWTLFLFVIAALGFLACGHVDDRNSIGLWYFLLNIRFHCRVLSHDQQQRMAEAGELRSLLLAYAR
jgi:hypothetical protein